MRLFLCATVLSTVLLSAFAYPADVNVPQPQAQQIAEADKQHKQNLFGIGIDLNLSKNGTLIPTPAFVNTSASYGSGIGAGGNFLVPLVPFPLGLLFPHPPLNITVGFSANKNVSAALVASTGNNVTVVEEDSGWEPSGWDSPPAQNGWGWTSTTTPAPGWGWPSTTTPAPSGWGWTTTSGWGPPPTTTPGWSPPPTTSGWKPTTTPGWSPPPTTPGWNPPPETTTTPGWGWVETTTPGWGWGVKKGINHNTVPGNAAGVNKPQNHAGPKPSPFSKPQQQATSGSENKPQESISNTDTYVLNVAESTLSSEMPSGEAAVQAEPLQVAEANEQVAPQPSINIPVQAEPLQLAEASEQAAPQPSVNVPLHVQGEALQVAEAIDNAPPMPSIQQDEIPMQVESLAADLAPASAPEAPVENTDAKVSVPISGKSKRHAGVEGASVLRIGDFEDVESPNEMNVPVYHEQMDQQEMSKEEMIIMAMEQTNSVAPGIVQLSNSRPAPLRPSLNQLQAMNKPMDVDDTDDANSVDMRNADSASLQVSESNGISKSVPKGKPVESDPTGERGGRNKPRPYGMDKPSKSRPTLDSKDKAEQFGLPHNSYDIVQKEQFNLPSGSSVLGWQVPDIKWSSFATIFQSFMGSSHKKNSMGKSDADDGKCVDDEEQTIRSPVIQGGSLCQTSTGRNSCHDACISSGFASGNCLGPYPTPGCLCRMPNHKDLGMMLSPLKKAPVEANREELMTSEAPQCKKCACAESCKGTGSYTGFCIDKCYCAVPWYTKEQA